MAVFLLNARLVLLFCVMLYRALADSSDDKKPPMKCRDGWLTYKNACYQFQANVFTYDQASKACTGDMSALLTVQNKDELQWITTQLMKAKSAMPFWVNKDGRDSPYNVPYNVPYTQEPDPAGGKRLCVVWGQNKYFHSEACAKKASALCKIKIPANKNSTCHLNFKGYCYRTLFTMADFAHAHNNCQAKNGSLLSIKDDEERDYLAKDFGFRSSYFWWTGLKYDTSSKTFQFTDGTPYSKDLVPWLDNDTLSDMGGDVCPAMGSNGKLVKDYCNVYHQPICKHSLVRSSETQCPDYWQRAGGSCYMVRKDRWLNWTAAKSDCHANKAHLLKTDSLDEQLWLQNAAGLAGTIFWTGINSKAKKGEYVWTDGSKVNTSVIKWENNDYSNFNCAVLGSSTKEAYITSCTSLSGLLSCEYKGLEHRASCMPGWTPHGHKCYYFSLQKGYMSWHDSRVKCYETLKSQAPYLNVDVNQITLENADQLQFVTSTVSKMGHGEYYSIWLGLTRDANTRTWSWEGAPDVLAFKVVNFNSIKQPLLAYRCGIMTETGTYSTFQCSATLNYVCEMDKKRKTGNGSASTLKDATNVTIFLLMALSLLVSNNINV